MAKSKGFFAGSKTKQQARESTIAKCGACGLLNKCDTPKMDVFGEGGRKVLFVAEAPGQYEDETGEHLVGKAGRYLREVLKRLRFDIKRDGWKTNAAICYPGKTGLTTEQATWCRPHLIATIKKLQPDVIVPLGQVALKSVLRGAWKGDVGGVERWTGWSIPCQTKNAWICPTYHPARVLGKDDPVLHRQFEQHLRKAISIEGKPWDVIPDAASKVKIVVDTDKAAKWLRQVVKKGQHGAIAFDYETDRLKPDADDSRIVSCSVAWGVNGVERCIAYPWHGDAITATGELLRSPVPKIACNLKFEDRWTRKAFGHRVRNWVYDTMLAAHILDNRSFNTSIKFQAFVRLGTPTWNDHIDQFLKSKGDSKVNQILREIDLRDLLLYNGLDSVLEFEVALHQMKEQGMTPTWL